MKVKEESEKVGLKLNIQKTNLDYILVNNFNEPSQSPCLFSVFCEDSELKKLLCCGTGVIRANEAQASPQGTYHSRESYIQSGGEIQQKVIHVS